ncbi:DNA repair protein XRCC4 isoform X3 [Eleginops maclovinus]|uniref:DNA repair protein XRCC4 isoform X3 n=1 Tax=Eleginops maclovinus TaxID=56733 RepID=UPI0030808588
MCNQDRWPQLFLYSKQTVPERLQVRATDHRSLSRCCCRMHVSVREVRVPSEPGAAYFLRVTWKGRGLAAGFQVLLTDGQDAWRGDVSEAAVCAEAEELEMQMDRYVQDIRQALTDTECYVTYSFNLTPSPPDHSTVLTLAYEKVQKDISFRLGSVVLKADPDPAEALRELLTHSLQRGNTLQQENQNLQQENLGLRGEHRRISADKGQKKPDPVKSADEEEEEDVYGGSTDEEEQQEVKMTPPSTSSTRESPLDDSLRDITDVAPCRKRRFRNLGPQDPAAKKRENPQSSQTEKTKRADPPAGSSKKQPPPRRPTDAAEVEDLFEDF